MPSASEGKKFFVLPPREIFAPDAAGAIALVVRRLASVTTGAVVLGQKLGRGEPGLPSFPGIEYIGVHNSLELIRAIMRENPACIDIHQQPRLALILSYLFPRRKILLFLHNDPLTMRGLKSRSGRRRALARLHRVVCVSDYLRTRYMSFLSGPAPSVLPNPITLADLPPAAELRDQTILFAGRIVPDKAPDVFVAACAIALPRLPGWRAVMCGGDRFGPASPETLYVKQIRAAAAQTGIEFTGPVPHGEVLRAMSAAAIAVVPSSWPEPFGLAALEALACGAALIATAQGGLPEVTGAAALIVPPDDANALAAAILALARDPARREALAAAGRARAQTFDTAVIAAALEKLRHTV